MSDLFPEWDCLWTDKFDNSQMPEQMTALTSKHLDKVRDMLACSFVRFKTVFSSTAEKNEAARRSFLSFQNEFLDIYTNDPDSHTLNQECKEIFSKGENDLYENLWESDRQGLVHPLWSLGCMTRNLTDVFAHCFKLVQEKAAATASERQVASRSSQVLSDPGSSQNYGMTSQSCLQNCVQTDHAISAPASGMLSDRMRTLSKSHKAQVLRELSESPGQFDVHCKSGNPPQSPGDAADAVFMEHMTTFRYTYCSHGEAVNNKLDIQCWRDIHQGRKSLRDAIERTKLSLSIHSADSNTGKDLHTILQDNAGDCLQCALEEIYPHCFALHEERSAALAQEVCGPLCDRGFVIPLTTWWSM